MGDSLSWQQAALGFAAEDWCSSKDALFDALKARHASPPRRKEFRDWASKSLVLPGLLKPLEASTPAEPSFVEIPVIRRDYSHLKKLRVYPLGDVHIGSPAHNRDKWINWLRYIESAGDTSMLGTGDFLNSALKTSVSDTYEEVLTVGAAKRQLRRDLQPLADKGLIDGLIRGNHEDRIWKSVGDCPIEDVADFLKVPYASASALFVYVVGDQEYTVYMRHGTGNGQSPAALLKAGNIIHADVFVSGHTHRQGVVLEDLFMPDLKRDVVERTARRFVSSGSFLQYERYCATRGYQPAHLGAPRITMSGTEHDVRVSV